MTRTPTCHPDRPYEAKGMCVRCYDAAARRAKGKPVRVILTLDEKIEKFTDRSSHPNGCHIWTGSVSKGGTPITWDRTTNKSVRRLLWEKLYGPIPAVKSASNTCHETACVNAEHLCLRNYGFGDDVERFWARVVKSGPVMRPELGECWTWTGGHMKGYPMFNPRPKDKRFAHRMMYEIAIGPIPDDGTEWCVCHKCDNPGCINPDHFFLGTDADNQRDCMLKGRKSNGSKHGAAVKAARQRKAGRAEVVRSEEGPGTK